LVGGGCSAHVVEHLFYVDHGLALNAAEYLASECGLECLDLLLARLTVRSAADGMVRLKVVEAPAVESAPFMTLVSGPLTYELNF